MEFIACASPSPKNHLAASEIINLAIEHRKKDETLMKARPKGVSRDGWRAVNPIDCLRINVRDTAYPKNPSRVLSVLPYVSPYSLTVLTASGKPIEFIDLRRPDADKRLARYVVVNGRA